MKNKPGIKIIKTKKNLKLRPQSHHYSNLIDRVRAYVISLEHSIITKEDVAEFLKVKVHLIEQCFQTLNLEGILSQPVKKSVNNMHWEPQWRPDYYYIYKKFNTIKEKNEIEYGNLILVSVEHANKLKDSIQRFLICNSQLDSKLKNCKKINSLSPSTKAVYDYNQAGSKGFKKFYSDYKNYINNPPCIKELNNIYEILKKGNDVALVANCANLHMSHLKILSDYFCERDIQSSILKFNKENLLENREFFIEGFFNVEFSNKYFNTSLEEGLDYFYYNLLKNNHKIKFTNQQLKKLIDKVIKENNIKITNYLLQNYEEIPQKLKDQMEALIVMHKLLEG